MKDAINEILDAIAEAHSINLDIELTTFEAPERDEDLEFTMEMVDEYVKHRDGERVFTTQEVDEHIKNMQEIWMKRCDEKVKAAEEIERNILMTSLINDLNKYLPQDG